MLWASMKMKTTTASPMARATLPYGRFAAGPLTPRPQSAIVKAAELVIEAGGFGLVVVDFGEAPRGLAHASALQITSAAERSGAAVIAIAPWRMCGTFAALSLATSRTENVVQPARSRLTGNVRRTCGGCDGGAEQDGRRGEGSRSRPGRSGSSSKFRAQ